MLLYLNEIVVAAVAWGRAAFRAGGSEANVARKVRGTNFTRRRARIEPTDDWDLLVPLFEWPEQKEYEEIRPLVLFGS